MSYTPTSEIDLPPQSALPGLASDGRPLVETLRAIDREINDLGALALRIQDTLSPVIVHEYDADRLKYSQGLDLLTQSLFGLSAFLTALEADLPPHWHVRPDRAAKAVTLSALSSRLSGCEETDEHRLGGDYDQVDSGDCELF